MRSIFPGDQKGNLLSLNFLKGTALLFGLQAVPDLIGPPLFPLFHSSRMTQPDDGVQEPDDTFDDCYYPEGAYYHVTETADDQE